MAHPQFAPAHPRPGFGDADHAELLHRVSEGDVDAFAVLVRVWWRPLVLYATRILDSIDAAEDVIQEAFIRLWERRTDWRPESSPKTLLYTMARNLALNNRKMIEVRARRLASRPYFLRVAIPTPIQAIEGNEARIAIREAIQALPAQRREVLMLSRYEGLSRAEIAAVTGLSPQTVANYLTIAIAELRQMLQPYLSDGD